jgi:hypothetical protein
MRKIATILLALAFCVAFAGIASATVLLTEGFSYANGNLVPNGGWATHSGSGTDVQVLGGRAQGNMNNAPDDNVSFTAQTATAKTYACFEVMIPDPGGSPHPNYFAHLKDSGTSNFAARVYVLPAGASGFTFGLTASSTSTTVQPVPWSTTPLSYGTTYFITIMYDASAGSAQLWVNPVNEFSPSITATSTSTGFLISSFALRQSSSLPTGVTGGAVWWNYSVDNVGVGTTFSDACYQVTPTRGTTWGQLKTLYR